MVEYSAKSTEFQKEKQPEKTAWFFSPECGISEAARNPSEIVPLEPSIACF